MPKYTVENVKTITKKNLNRIGNSVDEWADFLLRAANFYKYSFADQIVITALKPEATAIADFDTWSKKLNARIKRGAEGTPLLRDKNGQQVVSYFYNITDTDSTHQLWQMPMNNSEFNAKLAKAFKYKDNNKSAEEILQSQIIDKSYYLAEEILEENSSVTKQGLDNFIFCSISNILFKRCGFEPLYGGSDFDYLNSISDEQLVYIGAKLAESVKGLIVTVEKTSIAFTKENAAKEKEESLQNYTRQPRRYSLDPDKIGERLWNGKTVDEFTEQDIAAFMAETEAALSETPAENSAQIEQNNTNEQQEQPKQSNIIGNIPYRYISQKTYRKLERNLALKVADELENTDVKYSGRINDDNTVTLTVSRNDISTLEAAIEQIKKATPKKLRFNEVQIEEAKRTSLVDFLAARGEKLKRVGSNEYTMEAHDSMRINENRFYWNSQGKYGNAVTFCMEYYGLEFTAAVAELLRFKGYNLDYGEEIVYTQPARQPLAVEPQEELELKPLPYDLADNARRAYAYLTKTRMLNGDVVNRLIKNGSIAQDIKGNAVFKIFDDNNQLSGAEITGTTTDKRYKQVTERSGNGFIFNPTGGKPEKAIFFEAAIDALSYYCLNENTDALLVSMAGLKDKTVLKTVERYGLKPEQVYISSDYDEPGEKFAAKMQEEHGFKAYRVCDDIRFKNHTDIKDWNDLLRAEKAAPQKDVTQEEKSFAQQVDETLNKTLNPYTALKVCDTPQILLDIGCEQLPMLYTQQHLRDAIKEKRQSNSRYHGLNVDTIKELPRLLAEPLIIYDSLSRDDSIVIATYKKDNDNLPIVATVKPNGKGIYELTNIESNFVTSVHGRENFENQIKRAIETNKLLYIDKNKSQEVFKFQGLQLSEAFNSLDSNLIIHKSNNIVNSKTTQNNDISTGNQSVEHNSSDKQKSQEMFERWGLQLSELTNTLDSNIIIHKNNNIINSKTTQNSDISTENQPVEVNSISSITPDDNGIIGNTAYRYVPKKTYRKFDKEIGLKIAKALDDEKIKFSGRINDEGTITLTFDGNRVKECEEIIENIKNNAVEPVSEATTEVPDLFDIYQIKNNPEYHNIRFSSVDELNAMNITVNSEPYEMVYSGKLSDVEHTGGSELESIFTTFNINLPTDFKGHSLSVSDVVVIHSNNDSKAYYVDRIGFKELPDFFIDTQKLHIDDEKRSNETESVTYYVIEDLSTWANNSGVRSQLERFDNLDAAISKFKEYRNKEFDYSDGKSKTTLGISINNTWELDILHVVNDENQLCTDFTGNEHFLNSSQFLADLNTIRDRVGFDTVSIWRDRTDTELYDVQLQQYIHQIEDNSDEPIDYVEVKERFDDIYANHNGEVYSGNKQVNELLLFNEWDNPYFNAPLSEYVLANMPDDTVSIAERNEYGYTDNSLLPISEERALELFDNDKLPVFLLYEDNTEGQALTRDDIVNHKGMYGIETSEWESYITPLLAATKQVAAEQELPFSNRFSEGADEVNNPFVYDGTMSLEDFQTVQETVNLEDFQTAQETVKMTVYHGTANNFDTFQPDYRGAIWTDTNFDFAKNYAGNLPESKVLTCEAELKNLAHFTFGTAENWDIDTTIHEAKANGCDAAVIDFKFTEENNRLYKFALEKYPNENAREIFASLSETSTGAAFEGETIAEFAKRMSENNNIVHSFVAVFEPEQIKIVDRTPVYEKEEPQNTIHFHKVGAFYEAYGNDALLAADSLDLTFTNKAINGEKVPMVGIPQHKLRDYTKKLQDSGFTTEVRTEPYGYLNNIANTNNRDEQEQSEESINTSSDMYDIVESLAIGDVILYEGKRMEIEELDLHHISMKDLEHPDFGGAIIGWNEVLSYDGWQNDMREKGFEIISKADTKNSAQIEQKTENYKITALNYGTDREKCRNNIEAIKTLKTIEDENRTATPEEQEILSRYVGWGGLADVFDESKSAWTKEYAELKELLTDSEYTSARASTLNAHYTSPTIISAMYKALSNMSFSSGKILEPSMGIGNFFGMLPEAMSNSKLYGVELDGISGRIAKQLYPKAHIQIKGFEKTDFTSNTFDVAIGNVPFGDIPIYDKELKGSNLIHDYFFKKALDKVRQGGIVAFITSKGTLDKANSTVRRYLAERAELLGAVRLPNNAFKKNAGTEVTSDIIFLKKRNMPITLDDSNLPEWINLSKDSSGIEMNNYFVQHPEMVCGTMTEVSGRFGMETTCKPFDNADLSALIDTAISNINGSIGESYAEAEVSEYNSNINADIFPENYRNYCYTVIDNDIYYREGNNMVLQQFNKNKTTRIKGMIEISEALRELIKLQKENYPDENIKAQQDKLNTLYDRFTASYGLLSNHNNKSIFRFDDTAALLLSLENIDENGNLLSKADIFTKRTIYPYQPITSVNTASEALTVSISEKARVDLDFMSKLCGKETEEIIADLKGVIFENPTTSRYETADEYLSGNVREKLETARTYAKKDDKYTINVTALEQVQPEPLKPSEISVQLGSTWVPVQYFEQFMYELLNTPERCRSNFRWRSGNPFASSGDADNQTITVAYDENTATYGISNKSSYSADKGNVRASQTYGTGRMNAYTIIENTLNQKPVKIFDYVEDEKGTKRAVLNDKETLLAQDKQNSIKQAFQDWIFADAERTEDLCRIYNEKFNSLRPREYDGSHITFGGINPEISLLKHQKDAIAHTLYGGNTLLAHTVGAGKTFEMVASAMESKRLGLCTKSLICVPKAIVGQTAREFLQLYPTANILVPDEKDFSKANRERFCSRIATGNYDAVIISHTQLEKIPLSAERQIDFVQGQIDEITDSLEQLKFKTYEKGFTVKQLEATKKALTAKLEKLNNNDKRDTTITFEELGVDKLYVDEAHLFKNRFFTTKMGRNVSGINANSASQRAEDLAMKCRYLDEITDSKGVVFATGTPISNSMTELYTMQNYLQHDVMVSRGLSHFDAWASCFGETKLSLELAPEGKGYQMKTRFAKFFNLPELMNMFKEIADIKTADVLKLPVPEAVYHTVTAEPSEYQKDMVDGLAQRAKAIRDKRVSSDVDNMLNVTNDGRKLALDQRLLNELLPDNSHSKVNLCVDKVFEIWQNTAAQKSTQMIFCDLSTPDKSKFNVYDDIKSKLIKKGIPEDEIAFIHSYNTDEQKQQLFSKVRKGNIRVLLGSTEKMGTGTNVQNKLIAAHHLDCPWRPSDLEQRNGRIIRQGNTNPQVDIYNYVTKGTFDAYLYQLVENKQKFISQIMTSKSPARSAEDVDESVLSYAQIKALASGDPKIKEKMDLEIEVSRLRTVYAGYQEERRVMQTNITQEYPQRIQQLQERINGCKKDIEAASRTSKTDNFSPMTIYGKGTFTDKKEAGEALLAVRKPGLIGDYRGFKIFLGFNNLTKELNLILSLNTSHTIELGKDALGNITRIDNAINGIGKELNNYELRLEKVLEQLAAAKEEVNKPFPQKEELAEKERRLEVLDKELTIDKAEPENAAPEQIHTDLTKRSTEPVL